MTTQMYMNTSEQQKNINDKVFSRANDRKAEFGDMAAFVSEDVLEQLKQNYHSKKDNNYGQPKSQNL
ncbi:MAG: hypothetical protein ABH828_03585 [archaeon]